MAKSDTLGVASDGGAARARLAEEALRSPRWPGREAGGPGWQCPELNSHLLGCPPQPPLAPFLPALLLYGVKWRGTGGWAKKPGEGGWRRQARWPSFGGGGCLPHAGWGEEEEEVF